MQYNEKELSKLIDEVAKEFTACLNKAEVEEVSLSKSENDEERDHNPDEKEDAKLGEEVEHDVAEHHKEMGNKVDEEGHDYDDEDMEHMEKMYRSMSKGELKAHNDCIQKCMGNDPSMTKSDVEQEKGPGKLPGAVSEASKGQEKINKAESEHSSGGEIEKESIKNSPGAKSEASNAHGKEINKAERVIESCPPGKLPGAESEASDAHGKEINKSMEKSENTETDLLKSELATTTAELDKYRKNFDAVQEFLTKLVKKTAPQGKAITSLEVIAKSETSSEDKTLSKGEIHEVLKKKTMDPLLKSEDREAINKYYLSGQVNINSISHLLK